MSTFSLQFLTFCIKTEDFRLKLINLVFSDSDKPYEL